VRIAPETLAIRVPIFVGPTATVSFEGRSYTMPPEAANMPGTAFVYEDRIRMAAGRYETEHRRGGDTLTFLPEHRAAKLAAVHGARARLYEKRQQLLDLSVDVATLLTELVHRAPYRANEQVQRLYALDEEHGDDVLREAVSLVVADGPRTVSAVRTALASLGDLARVERRLVLERVSQLRGARACDAAKPSRRAERRGGSR
jgi:hypothetical protein